MGILAWVLLGVVAAWLERQLFPRGPRSSFLASMILAFCGAVLGNLIAYSLGYAEIAGFNARTVVISAVGVAIILVAYRLILNYRARAAQSPSV